MINFQPTSVCVRAFTWLQQRKSLLCSVASHIVSIFNTKQNLYHYDSARLHKSCVPDEQCGVTTQTRQLSVFCSLGSATKAMPRISQQQPLPSWRNPLSLLLEETSLFIHKQLPHPSAPAETSPQHLAGQQHGNPLKQ